MADKGKEKRTIRRNVRAVIFCGFISYLIGRETVNFLWYYYITGKTVSFFVTLFPYGSEVTPNSFSSMDGLVSFVCYIEPIDNLLRLFSQKHSR